MDYPSYPPVIPNAFFAYPWYGYAGNSIAWNRTLTDEELEIIERIVNDHERRWSE